MKTKKSKIARIIAGTLALTAVAAVAAGGTFAFMTALTEEKINNFSFDVDSLNANLTETEWNGIKDYDSDGTPIYGYTSDNKPIYGYTDGDINKPVYEETGIGAGTRPKTDAAGNDIIYGDTASKNMIPGAQAAKNPVITNTGTVCNEWVAAKITFVYGGGKNKGKPLSLVDIQRISDIISIDYNIGTSDKWERISGNENTVSQVFYYKEILNIRNNKSQPKINGDKTEPIFTTVKFKDTATNEDVEYLRSIGGFYIYIEGFAAQEEAGKNYEEFKEWGMNDNVVFTHTPTDENPLELT